MSSKKLVIIALYISLALVFSWIESYFPIPMPIPGAKLGLANIVTLLALATLGALPSLFIVIARILLAGFLFGSMSSILYALAGGLLSYVTMAIFINRVNPKNVILISIIGAITHNIGQLIVASLVVWNSNLFLYYFPFLILLAISTGFITGLIAALVLKYLNNTHYFV